MAVNDQFFNVGNNPNLDAADTGIDPATGRILTPAERNKIFKSRILSQQNRQKIADYRKESATKNEMQRTDLNKDKSGVFTGSYAINPVNNKKIPIWIGDYVLLTYGSGAIMAVPGHDERDYEFAKKYSLDIVQVVNDILYGV